MLVVNVGKNVEDRFVLIREDVGVDVDMDEGAFVDALTEIEVGVLIE